MANHPEDHPVDQTIQPPRKINPPGKPAQPSISGPSGAVESSTPVDYSSRLPGGHFIPRPG